MQARSYVENIANRTTMRGVVFTMTCLLAAVAVLGAVAINLLSGFHPVALILGFVLLVLALVLGRDVVIMGRAIRANPLDLAFEPASRDGLASPGTIFGAAGGLALFGLVMALAMLLTPGEDTFTAPLAMIGVGLALGIVGLPTLTAHQRTWRVLADALAKHPEMIPYLQDARRRFPADAPFPFSAPTDVVTIP